MLSFCNQTRKISAGTRNGQIIIYDLRTLKSQVVVAHNGAVSALCFSPAGKYLASYSQGKIIHFIYPIYYPFLQRKIV